MSKVAFVGLGNMGTPMAAHLASAGHDVIGFDQSRETALRTTSHGIAVADSLRHAVEHADVVVTMLPNGAVVEEVLTGPDGVFKNLPASRLVIDCSTIDAAVSVRLHEVAEASGHSFLDAPVSGGMTGAENGTLTFMVGGEAELVESSRPLLEAMGARVVHAGPAGSGSAAKIVNNMLLGISLAGVCEAFVLADRMGLEASTFFDIATTSSGDCWALRTWTPVAGIVDSAPSSNGWIPGFSSDLMLKDLRLASEAASQNGVALEVGDRVRALYEQHVAEGKGDLDCSSLIDLMQEAR